MVETPQASTLPAPPRSADLPRFATEFSAIAAVSVAVLILIVLLLVVWWRPRKTVWMLSIMCLVLLTVLWIRSYWQFERVFISDGKYIEISISAGQVFATWSDAGPTAQERASFRWWSRAQGSSASIPSGRIVYAGWRQLGFGAGAESSFYGGVPTTFHRVVVPFWFLVCLILAWPTIRLLARKRRRERLLQGCCPACGYDLRATSGACPECGAVAAVRPPHNQGDRRG